MVTRWSYGNTLYYGLSIFAEFGNVCNTFKYNWNSFCWKKKYINIHRVYEHIYYSNFIMIPLLVMLLTAGGYLCVVFLWIIIKQSWTWHNATHYHNLNALSQALLYILSEIYMVLGYVPRVTMCYGQFVLKSCDTFFYKFDGNAW